MIEVKIIIAELEEPDKKRGVLYCTADRDNPTEEELMLERKVFDHVKLIGQELSELRGGTKVSMIEGRGGKQKGRDRDE